MSDEIYGAYVALGASSRLDTGMNRAGTAHLAARTAAVPHMNWP